MAKTKDSQKDLQEKMQEMQLLQHRLSIFGQQKQQFQVQLIEVENALEEVSKTKSPIYKMIGGLLVQKQATEVKKELAAKKKELDTRVKSFETQEKKIRARAEKLQKELTKVLK